MQVFLSVDFIIREQSADSISNAKVSAKQTKKTALKLNFLPSGQVNNEHEYLKDFLPGTPETTREWYTQKPKA